MVLLQDKDARDSKEPQMPDKAGRAPSQSLQGCMGLTPGPKRLPGQSVENEFGCLEPRCGVVHEVLGKPCSPQPRAAGLPVNQKGAGVGSLAPMELTQPREHQPSSWEQAEAPELCGTGDNRKATASPLRHPPINGALHELPAGPTPAPAPLPCPSTSIATLPAGRQPSEARLASGQAQWDHTQPPSCPGLGG